MLATGKAFYDESQRDWFGEQFAGNVTALNGAGQRSADASRKFSTAALVEQTAAAAGSLHDQANALADRVSRFRLPA